MGLSRPTATSYGRSEQEKHRPALLERPGRPAKDSRPASRPLGRWFMKIFPNFTVIDYPGYTRCGYVEGGTPRFLSTLEYIFTDLPSAEILDRAGVFSNRTVSAKFAEDPTEQPQDTGERAKQWTAESAVAAWSPAPQKRPMAVQSPPQPSPHSIRCGRKCISLGIATGLRDRNSPICTLSQNGYGAENVSNTACPRPGMPI